MHVLTEIVRNCRRDDIINKLRAEARTHAVVVSNPWRSSTLNEVTISLQVASLVARRVKLLLQQHLLKRVNTRNA